MSQKRFLTKKMPYLTGWTSIPRHWGFHPTIGCFPGIRRSLRDITNIKWWHPWSNFCPWHQLRGIPACPSRCLGRAEFRSAGKMGSRKWTKLWASHHFHRVDSICIFCYGLKPMIRYFLGGWTAIHQLFRYIFRSSPGDPKVLTHPIFHRGIILLTLSGSSTARAGCCTGWKLQTLGRGKWRYKTNHTGDMI